MLAELKPSLRALLHRPLAAIAAIVTIALGVTANTAVFAVLHAVLLSPLPFPEPDRLVRIHGVAADGGSDTQQIFPPAYLALEEEPAPAEGVAAVVSDDQMTFRFRPAGEETLGEPMEARGAVVSARFFSLLGVEAERGRLFRPEEDEPGADRVAVLAHGLWRRAFGGDPEILDRRLDLNDRAYTVIGILPRGLELPRGVEIWVPGPERSSEIRNLPIFFYDYFDVYARLPAGVSPEAAEQILDRRYRETVALHPNAFSAARIRLVPLQEDLRAGSADTLAFLQAAGLALLILCCANVAGLLLIRSVRRRGELALRVVLGAARRRLLGQLTLEHGILFLLGGALGLAGAFAVLRLLVAGAPAGWLQLADVRLSGATLAVTLASVTVAGLLFGSLPGFAVLRGDLAAHAREGLAAGSGSRHRLGEAIVVVEIAVAIALLLATGLLVRSLLVFQDQELGFEATSLSSVPITLLQSRYPERASREAFFERLRSSLEAVPGIEAVGGSQYFFLTDGVYGSRVTGVDGDRFEESERVAARAAFTMPGYFEALRLPLLAGRAPAGGIGPGTPAEAVVARSLSRRLWGETSPIGRRLELDGREWTVVGVSEDLRKPGDEPEQAPELFLPHTSAGLTTGKMTLLVRATPALGDPAAAIRSRVREIDPGQTVAEIRPVAEIVAREAAPQRYGARLLGAFALLATVLAAVGVYAVLAYAVASRRREIGVRAALGASPSNLARSVASHGLRLGVLGAVLGGLGGVAVARGLQSLLFGVDPWDPWSWGVTLGCGLAIAVLAAWVPSLRARRVDPAVALRDL